MSQRDDVGEAFVDSVDTIYEITKWGITHNYKGHTYAIKYGDAYVGIILLGEALEWETDPDEMKDVPLHWEYKKIIILRQNFILETDL